jgi:hypothetical protein
MSQSSGFRRVVRDIADLCELQFELLAVDGKLAKRHSGIAAAILTFASILGLSAALTTVLALAAILHEHAEWTIGASLLASAGIAAFIGAIFAVVGSLFLKKAMAALDESRSEFAENLRWIRAAIVAPEDSPRAQVNERSFRTKTSAGFRGASGMNGNLDESHCGSSN